MAIEADDRLSFDLPNHDARQARRIKAGLVQVLVDQAVARFDGVLLRISFPLCERERLPSSVYEVPKAAIIGTLRHLPSEEKFVFPDCAAVTGVHEACPREAVVNSDHGEPVGAR